MGFNPGSTVNTSLTFFPLSYVIGDIIYIPFIVQNPPKFFCQLMSPFHMDSHTLSCTYYYIHMHTCKLLNRSLTSLCHHVSQKDKMEKYSCPIAYY